MLASEILRLVFGFVAVLGMIGLCAYAAKKAGLSSMAGVANGKRRLALSEMLAIDARRRLAIVRCDDKEYLILIGANGETLLDEGLEGAEKLEPQSADAQVNPFGGLAEITAKLRAGHKRAA